MRIVVIGAGGFVGGWICEENALEPTVSQVACVRNWSSAVRIARRGVEVRRADLETSDLVGLVAEADAVVNASMPLPSMEPQLVTALYRACAAAGVKRFIQLSSAAVYGDRTGVVDERCAPQPVDAYSRGKTEMERLLFAAASERVTGPQVVVLRPSIIYGPFSEAWTVRYVQRILVGRWRNLGALGRGTCNLIYAQDVARAVQAAAARPLTPGHHLINLNGAESVTWNDYIERLGDALDVANRATPHSIKVRGMVLVAEAMRRAARLASVKSMYRRSVGPTRVAIKNAQSITKLYPAPGELELLKRQARYSQVKADRMLGLGPGVALSVGIEQSVAWCRIHGIAPPSPDDKG